jgi:hypothetical protein
MMLLEVMATLVTICGGILAALYWFYSRMAALRRENDELRAYIAAMQAAPQQPAGADYLQDAQGERLCIRCFHTAQKQWKLIKEGDHWHCPVCGSQSIGQAQRSTP